MYVKVYNNEIIKYPYSMQDLRSDNPNTSFPLGILDDDLSEYGVYPVSYQDKPDFDATLQDCAIQELPTLIDYRWLLCWEINDFTEEELQHNLAVDEDLVRSMRRTLLAETDWMALNDNTMTPEWAAYRQALRDITSQEGFPYDITWPTKP